jgi:site-specific recombinase XerD
MTAFTCIEPHLYARAGKRVTSYFTMVQGRYVSLGRNLELAKAKRDEMQGKRVAIDTIEDMCAGFLREQIALRKGGDTTALSELSVKQYAVMLKRVCKVFGAMPPRQFLPMHKAQYLSMRKKGNPEKGIKPAATGANREMAALGSAFEYGLREGLVSANPTRGVRRNKETPRTRSPAISEVNEFMQMAMEMGECNYMIALIGVTVGVTGRRRSEFIRLTKSAAADDGLHCKDSKTKAGQPDRFYVVGWSDLLRQVIQAAQSIKRKKESIYLFPARHGGPFTDSGWSSGWQRLQKAWVKRKGERFRAHDLRALYVSDLSDRGIDPNTHKDPATQKRVYDRRTAIKVKALR